MHLKRLTGGGPQRSVAESVGQFIHRQEQASGDAAPRAAQAQHHLPGFVFPLLAFIAIILLIAAVELQQLQSVFAEVGELIAEFVQQWLLEKVAITLALFCLGKRRSLNREPAVACALGSCGGVDARLAHWRINHVVSKLAKRLPIQSVPCRADWCGLNLPARNRNGRTSCGLCPPCTSSVAGQGEA